MTRSVSRHGWALVLAVGLTLASGTASAEVTTVTAGGFSVRHQISTSANAEKVWSQMLEIGEWWNPEHSWSKDPANLYLRAEPGGCFCERLPADAEGPAGGVEHLRIVYVNPHREIRFDGALGPLIQMPVQGRMLWEIEPLEGGSTVTFDYHIHGFLEGGFEGLAPAVDGVIGEQLGRLAAALGKN